MHAARPADHDDYYGGAVRRAAAGLRHRDGIGASPAAGHHDRRRAGGQPDAHALHNARGLSCAGPAAPARDGKTARHVQPRGRPNAGRSGLKSMNPGMSQIMAMFRFQARTTLTLAALLLTGRMAGPKDPQ